MGAAAAAASVFTVYCQYSIELFALQIKYRFFIFGDTICNNEFIVIQHSNTSKKPFIDITDSKRSDTSL